MKPTLESLERRDCPAPLIAPLSLVNDGMTVFLRHSDPDTGAVLHDAPTLVPPAGLVVSIGDAPYIPPPEGTPATAVMSLVVTPEMVSVFWAMANDPETAYRQDSYDGGWTFEGSDEWEMKESKSAVVTIEGAPSASPSTPLILPESTSMAPSMTASEPLPALTVSSETLPINVITSSTKANDPIQSPWMVIDPISLQAIESLKFKKYL